MKSADASQEDWGPTRPFCGRPSPRPPCFVLVKSLRRDVRAIGPSHGTTVEEEALKVLWGFQRFEDRTIEPGAEVDRLCGVIVESQVNAEPPAVLSLDHRWQGVHRALEANLEWAGV
jgi:hypothetical protein